MPLFNLVNMHKNTPVFCLTCCKNYAILPVNSISNTTTGFKLERTAHEIEI